jgi:hypothetical protein
MKPDRKVVDYLGLKWKEEETVFGIISREALKTVSYF